jgi:signal transduction histidine kinase
VRNIVRHADATAVVLSVARRGEDELVVGVRDDGRGLGDTRSDARRRGSVGLDLLARLVTAQGGRLTVRDVEGGGTELVVVLPVANPAATGPVADVRAVAVGDR